LPVPAKPIRGDLRGLLPAGVVLLLWFGSWLAVAWMPLSWQMAPIAVVVVLARTFLCTGLFITAHDAMHGTLTPGRPRLNDALGATCAFLFAGFRFSTMRTAHYAHHATPASNGDPDWHNGDDPRFFAWLFAFGRRYVRWWQVLGIAVLHNVLVRAVGLPEPNLWLFLWLPPVLAALQLFTFGTWMPHRRPAHGHTNRHHAMSIDYPVWLSFLTCYHFGYHLTHHAFPWVPWWRLPGARRVRLGRVRPPLEHV
jgi:beta-carotene ketolase (CrtW type)